LQTAESLAPAILAAAAASDPRVAVVAQFAPVAIQLLQSAMQLQQAGVISSTELAAMFALIGNGIQNTHSQWAAMNAAEAK
jgi:hypothetical protein